MKHHVSTNQKKIGIALLISDIANFRMRTISRNREGHYAMMKK